VVAVGAVALGAAAGATVVGVGVVPVWVGAARQLSAFRSSVSGSVAGQSAASYPLSANSRHRGQRHQLRARPTIQPAALDEASRPKHRLYREAQALMPPFRRINWSRGSESGLYAAAYLITRDHLLRVLLSALAEPAVHRMMAANGSSRSDTFKRRKLRARRARLTSRPSAVHQATNS
jgi:hypothetical protein